MRARYRVNSELKVVSIAHERGRCARHFLSQSRSIDRRILFKRKIFPIAGFTRNFWKDNARKGNVRFQNWQSERRSNSDRCLHSWRRKSSGGNPSSVCLLAFETQKNRGDTH